MRDLAMERAVPPLKRAPTRLIPPRSASFANRFSRSSAALLLSSRCCCCNDAACTRADGAELGRTRGAACKRGDGRWAAGTPMLFISFANRLLQQQPRGAGMLLPRGLSREIVQLTIAKTVRISAQQLKSGGEVPGGRVTLVRPASAPLLFDL